MIASTRPVVLFIFLLGFNTAHAVLKEFQVTYTPTVGSVFTGQFTIDDSDILATNTFVGTRSFSVVRDGIEWTQGVDGGDTRIQVNMDLFLSDASLDGQIFDTVAPLATNQIFTHDAFARVFSISDAGNVLTSGTFSLQQIPIPAPSVAALFLCGALGVSLFRRKPKR